MFENYDLSLAMIEMSSSLLCLVLYLYIVSILDVDVFIFCPTFSCRNGYVFCVVNYNNLYVEKFEMKAELNL